MSKRTAQVLSALGDPVRLRLLSIVATECDDVYSGNLELPLVQSQPTVSRPTRILAETGPIVGNRRGK